MAEQKLTHWKLMMNNSDYIGAYTFQPGEEKTLTIRSCGMEQVYNPSENKKETCMVIHWMENEKPLIANVTNCKTISKVLETSYTEQWVGKRIVLGVEKVKAFGDVVEAVRVKKKKAAAPIQQAQTIMCADCKKPIAAYGNMTPDQVAQRSKSKFGVCLCTECGVKRMDGGNV